MVLFHDVIYETEIKELKSVNPSSLKHDRSGSYRSSMKFTTLEKKVNDVLSYRIRDMTGMQICNDKNFMLINYGLGGHIGLPYDEEEVSCQIRKEI